MKLILKIPLTISIKCYNLTIELPQKEVLERKEEQIMKYETEYNGVGGWNVPCSPCDYRKLEWAARQECEAIRGRLAVLKQEDKRDGEKELLRRRSIRILTDMYYEQRSNIFLFQQRAQEQEQKKSAGQERKAPSLPAATA